jgi:hypothetical protein
MTDKLRNFHVTPEEYEAVEQRMPYGVLVPEMSDDDDPYIIGPIASRQEAEVWASRYSDAIVTRLATPEFIEQTHAIAAQDEAYDKPRH